MTCSHHHRDIPSDDPIAFHVQALICEHGGVLSDKHYKCDSYNSDTWTPAWDAERFTRSSTQLPLLLLKYYGWDFIASVKTSEAAEPGQVQDCKSI